MIKKTIIYFTFIIVFFTIAPITFASGNFNTDYHIIYSVNETGTTHASLNVTLTNLTSQYYASSYKIQLGFDTISNLHAGDADGQISPVLEKSPDGYVISLQFNKKAVGLGSKLNFNLSFDTPNVAKQYGKIWEINIPGIANSDDFDAFTVEVKNPPSFGKPAYIKPRQNSDSLIFTKDQLGKSGISISFGDKQLYSFHLLYHLQNTNVYPVKTEIALPPTTNYQTIFLQNIDPKPANVTLDADGNWLAQYHLLPSQKLDISVDGKAQVGLSPKQETVSPGDLSVYLEEKPYWQTKATEIRELADDLKTPEAIYEYVVKTLKYDFSRVTQDKPRLGALGALKNQSSAVCLEYTDLFIALARAANIPAREVDGFAYTENSKQRPLSLVKDILHAWPEYYDSQRNAWIMVDPTWGSTTGGVDYFSMLDFDHFAFVIKGIDNGYPIPAGGYKIDNSQDTKDVSVSFAQNVPPVEQSSELISGLPDMVMSGLPIQGKVTVRNTGQSMLASQMMDISSDTLLPHEQTTAIQPVPPYGTTDVSIGFNPPPFLTNKIESFTIRVNDKAISQTVDISPLMLKKWGIFGGAGIGLFFIIILIVTIKSRRL